jgi:hypothetical protein
MHRIEKGSLPGQAHLSEVFRAACLLQGSTRLDQKAEDMLLLPLFDGVPLEYERWKRDDPQGYISQVRGGGRGRGAGAGGRRPLALYVGAEGGALALDVDKLLWIGTFGI